MEKQRISDEKVDSIDKLIDNNESLFVELKKPEIYQISSYCCDGYDGFNAGD